MYDDVVLQLGYASWTAMVRTFGHNALCTQKLEPLKSMLGRVKLSNNPEERVQGWYTTDAKTKVRKHHEQIELFISRLQDNHRLSTRRADVSTDLPNYSKNVLGPSDLQDLNISTEVIEPDADRLNVEFAYNTFAADKSPTKLPKINMSGFNIDVEYEMDGADGTSIQDIDKFVTSFKAATTEKFWTGTVFCSFQQMEKVSIVYIIITY